MYAQLFNSSTNSQASLMLNSTDFEGKSGPQHSRQDVSMYKPYILPKVEHFEMPALLSLTSAGAPDKGIVVVSLQATPPPNIPGLIFSLTPDFPLSKRHL
jgi:hypothetical protein